MKKNQSARKLKLSKETFKRLDETGLEEVEGATAIRSCMPETCIRSLAIITRCC